MSKQDLDSEFDDFFNEDDPVLIEINKKRAEEIKKQQEKKKKVQSGDKKILLQRGEINQVIVNQIYKDPDYKIYLDKYINQGMELNRAIRNREPLDDAYKSLLSKLNILSKQVKEIFPGKDYIRVCRMMSKFYDENLPSQPMSTANICLSEFGNKTLHIYIPKDAYILIRDISKEMTDPITGKTVKIFEIIIPPLTPNRSNQNLLDLDEAGGDNYVKYYVVSSPESIKHFQDFVEIYKQDSINDTKKDIKKDTEEM